MEDTIITLSAIVLVCLLELGLSFYAWYIHHKDDKEA